MCLLPTVQNLSTLKATWRRRIIPYFLKNHFHTTVLNSLSWSWSQFTIANTRFAWKREENSSKIRRLNNLGFKRHLKCWSCKHSHQEEHNYFCHAIVEIRNSMERSSRSVRTEVTHGPFPAGTAPQRQINCSLSQLHLLRPPDKVFALPLFLQWLHISPNPWHPEEKWMGTDISRCWNKKRLK